jgi:MFS transporter, ACS family, 4-hydroxyphenylacetate permease
MRANAPRSLTGGKSTGFQSTRGLPHDNNEAAPAQNGRQQMTATVQSSILSEAEADALVVRKVFRRLVWFLFVLLVVSFVDRINVAFAALTMNKDLGLSSAAFGLSLTVFYAAYTLCEIPSNLALARFGARLWIARIMITWGFAAAATMFATGAWSLYGYRAIVGIAEAGFFPGMFLYMTYWFPRTCRARANALFVMGIPVTIAAASTTSGFILQMDGFLGLAGWRWLFLLEGLPAVVLGVVCLFYLVDGPAQAKWLNAEEKREILTRLERDRALEEAGATGRGILAQLGSRNVLLLSAAYFGLVTSLNANATWVPQVVQGFAHGMSYGVIGLLTAAPAVLTVAVMPFWGASSDRRGERAWHLRVAMLVAAVGWLLIVAFDEPAMRYLGLILTSVGSFCALLTFWTIPASATILSPKARPSGIALINCVGIGGGSSIGPFVVGYLKDKTGHFTAGFLYVVVMLVIAVVCISIIAAQTRMMPAVPSASSA